MSLLAVITRGSSARPRFREQQSAPKPEMEGKLLVITENNKDVPLMRPPETPRPEAHLSKGQKRNKKQMACIGCVYSVDPHVRTPEKLEATHFRDEDRPHAVMPASQQKQIQQGAEFMESNLHGLRYNEYLQARYPLAAGVIEGACRHLLRDRIESSGMRWKVPGAQAMLHLRAI